MFHLLVCCIVWYAALRMSGLLSLTEIPGVFTLRTFAIYKRNYFILAILVLVASVKVFISAVCILLSVHLLSSRTILQVDFFVSAKVAAQAPAFRQFGSCNEVLPPDAKQCKLLEQPRTILIFSANLASFFREHVFCIISTRLRYYCIGPHVSKDR